MRGWTGPLALALVLGALAHLLVVGAIPTMIMGVAMNRIAETSGGWNRMAHAPRITPESQRIVRSSPDLAYSTCALDLSKGPVRAFVAKGADYASVALYAANTDNVFSLNDTNMPAEGARLMIVSARSPIAAQPGEQVVSLPSDRGVLLVRRLAPTADAFAAANAARQGDTCAAVDVPGH